MLLKSLIFKNSVASVQVGRLLRQQSRRFGLTSQLQSNDKIYELRKYLVKPGAFRTYKQLTTDLFHLRTSESKLCGFWFAELGTSLFQSVHIWEYDSLSHRAEVRRTLDTKKEWQEEYFSKAMPCLSHLENISMFMPSWSSMKDTSTSEKGGVYELVTYNMVMGGPAIWEKKLHSSIDAHVRLGYVDLMGVFYTDLGNHNTVEVLWRYNSFEDRHDGRIKAHNDAVVVNKIRDNLENVTGHTSMIMLPAPWSPMQ